MPMVLSSSEACVKTLQTTKGSLNSLLSLKAVAISAATVLSFRSHRKSTTLAPKNNVCPNVPFVFLNNLYPCPRVTLLGANSNNLSHFPVIIFWLLSCLSMIRHLLMSCELGTGSIEVINYIYH